LRRTLTLGAVLLLVAAVVTGCDDEDLGDANAVQPSLGEITSEVQALSTLNSALQQAGLAETLQNDAGPFTVFMPVNGAFESIETNELLLDRNEALLTEVLSYHVVPQRIKFREGSGALGAGTTQTFETLEGDSLTVRVTDSEILVNGTTVSNADVDATNGVAHVTEGVLLETTDAVDRAALAPQFSTLRRLIEEAGVGSTLRGMGPDASDGITVFAPTNEAFLAALDANDNGRVDDDELPSNLSDVLAHHVVDGVYFAEDVPTGSAATLSPLAGPDLTAERSDDGVTVSSPGETGSVVAADVRVENGVIHGIDTVLLP
jgi:uncharacterized surface protein with fasciclin (FAS1) repeats